jgi:diaminohydroxyphosphoribosylaminopyrimidine deaminase/5-amino-6-(5-phosphoribosylamino)uracil reductase
MADDRRYMKHALELAKRAEGRTAPNPMVGCVLVKDGKAVGEGWHKGAGLPHAEVEAIANAGAGAKGSTAYVTLEPCNHHGRTPPCTEAVIAAGIAEVVYAMPDPNPAASGGAEKLRRAGIKVRTEVCAEEAKELNRFWLYSLRSPRPWVIAKFAMSLDGKIATAAGDSKWITGPEARSRAHELRRSVDAIVVGAGTIIADDPALTARIIGVETGFPLRVVLDSTGRTPLSAAVFDRSGRGALLATTAGVSEARLNQYRELGVDVRAYGLNGRPDVEDLLIDLRARGCLAVLVEGGAETLGSFFDAGLVDEVHAFLAPVIVGGGKSAVSGEGVAAIAAAHRLTDIETETLGRDILVRGLVCRGVA